MEVATRFPQVKKRIVMLTCIPFAHIYPRTRNQAKEWASESYERTSTFSATCEYHEALVKNGLDKGTSSSLGLTHESGGNHF